MIKEKEPNSIDCEGGDSKDKSSARSEGRESRSYYYDDAHGYEEFDPEAGSDDEDEDETTS